eukprot:314098_1
MDQHTTKYDILFNGYIRETKRKFEIIIPAAIIQLITLFYFEFQIYALGDNHHGIFGHKEPTENRNIRHNQHILKKLQNLAASINDIYFNKTSITVGTRQNKIYISGHGTGKKLFLDIDTNKAWCYQINYDFRKLKFSFMDNLSIICSGWEMTSHTIAMTKYGNIYAAGSNYTGAFGNGEHGSHKSILCTEISNSFVNKTDKIIAIKCGNYHSVFLTKFGNVFCCGENHVGQCGIGNGIQHVTTPTHIKFDTKIKHISCGWSHNIFINNNDELYVFGSNAYGALGIGDKVNNDKYKRVWKPIVNEYFGDNNINIMSAECGGEYSVCIDRLGYCYTFGSNYWGYIGNGKRDESHSEDMYIPYKLKINDEFETISCGGSHNVALSRKNRIITWGSNIYKQCGRFDTSTRYPYIWSKKQELGVEEDTFVQKAIALRNATVIILSLQKKKDRKS